jgi:protein SCO1/2
VKLLSFSVTPQIDSVAQLKRYAIEKEVNDQKWNLVTGDKKEIYTLARKSFLAVKEEGDGGPYDSYRKLYFGRSRKTYSWIL